MLETTWGAMSEPARSLARPSHLSPEQLGLRRPGALNLVAHAVEQGNAILVLVKMEELRQDLSSFLWKGRTNRNVRSSWSLTHAATLPQGAASATPQIPDRQVVCFRRHCISGRIVCFLHTPG